MVERHVCAALWRAWRLQFLPTTLVVQVVQSVRYARLCVLNHTPAILTVFMSRQRGNMYLERRKWTNTLSRILAWGPLVYHFRYNANKLSAGNRTVMQYCTPYWYVCPKPMMFVLRLQICLSRYATELLPLPPTCTIPGGAPPITSLPARGVNRVSAPRYRSNKVLSGESRHVVTKIAEVCSDRPFAQSAKFINLTFLVVIVMKYFWRGCFTTDPSLSSPCLRHRFQCHDAGPWSITVVLTPGERRRDVLRRRVEERRAS